MSSSPDSIVVHPYRCRDCGSEMGFRSRRRSLAERFILPLFLLRPVRCSECFHRDYRLIFTHVLERGSELRRILPVKDTVTAKRNIA